MDEQRRSQPMTEKLLLLLLLPVFLVPIFLLFVMAEMILPLNPESLIFFSLNSKTAFFVCNMILLVVIVDSGLIRYLVRQPDTQATFATSLHGTDEHDENHDDNDEDEHDDNDEEKLQPESEKEEEGDVDELTQRIEEFIDKMKRNMMQEGP